MHGGIAVELKCKAKIMDAAAIDRTLVRIAHEILEKNDGTEDLCLIGIHTRGVPLARRLAENIARIDGVRLPVGELDISLYRDDLSPAADTPVLNRTDVPFPVAGKTVVLIDDVIYTCRTARAALGRPARIQLFALIDRGHSELPIKATYVGKNIPTAKSEIVAVRLQETDGENSVCILERGDRID